MVAAERAMARWAPPRSGGSACPAELATRDQGHVLSRFLYSVEALYILLSLRHATVEALQALQPLQPSTALYISTSLHLYILYIIYPSTSPLGMGSGRDRGGAGVGA